MMLNSSRDDWEEKTKTKTLFYFSMLSSTFYTSPLKRSGRRPLVRVRFFECLFYFIFIIYIFLGS